MVQIQLPSKDKEEVGSMRQIEDTEDNLLPTYDPSARIRALQLVESGRRRSLASSLLVLLGLVFMLTMVKQICDLKEQNLWLVQRLALERQKDAALRLAVRDNIPSNKFLHHKFSKEEEAEVEEGGKVEEMETGWTINLSVLWTSPKITPCDMARLSHMLAKEIYAHREEHLNLWTEEEEPLDNEDKEEEEDADFEKEAEQEENLSSFKQAPEFLSTFQQAPEIVDTEVVDNIEDILEAVTSSNEYDYEWGSSKEWGSSEELLGDDSWESEESGEYIY